MKPTKKLHKRKKKIESLKKDREMLIKYVRHLHSKKLVKTDVIKYLIPTDLVRPA